jgi:hypothetical protein
MHFIFLLLLLLFSLNPSPVWGQPIIQGQQADGAAAAGFPVRVGGKDGAGNAQDLATDTNGELQVDVTSTPSGASAQQVQGTAAAAAASVGNPVQVGGVDGGGLMRAISTDTTGKVNTVDDTELPAAAALADGAGATPTTPTVGTVPSLFNGTTLDRIRSASASTLTATTSTGVALAVPLSTWSVTHTPAANTQATASKGSGGGSVRHVTTSIHACFAGTAAAAPVQVNLRDGASGAGTVLWSGYLGIEAVNAANCINVSGLAFIGTAATAMTLEFAAGGGASTNQTVSLTGFSVP